MSKLLSPSSHHHLNGHGHNHHHSHHNPMTTNTTMTKVLRSVSNRQQAASQQPLITDFLPCIKSSASSVSSSGSSGTTKSSSSSTNVSNGRCSSRLANRKKSQETEELRKVCICSKMDPPGFVIKHFGPVKGRGVVARKTLQKGDFVCEYSGDLIDVKEAKKREKMYEDNGSGCYMYYFDWKNEKYCVDATIDPTRKRLGRLINHSRKSPNCKTRIYEIDGIPHLIFVALKDIQPGHELLYDYGETDKQTIEANPWLATS